MVTRVSGKVVRRLDGKVVTLEAAAGVSKESISRSGRLGKAVQQLVRSSLVYKVLCSLCVYELNCSVVSLQTVARCTVVGLQTGWI